MHDLDAMSLLLGLLFTWIIGMTPPLLIRYLLVKGPMDKKGAIITSTTLGIFNLILFIALGSQSKSHAVLILIAIISYRVLKKAQSAKEFERSAKKSPTTIASKDASTYKWYKKVVFQKSWRTVAAGVPLAILIVLAHTNHAIEQQKRDYERYTLWAKDPIAFGNSEAGDPSPGSPELQKLLENLPDANADLDGGVPPLSKLQRTFAEPMPPKNIGEYASDGARQMFFVWLLGAISIFTALSTLSFYLTETEEGWRRLSIVAATAISVLAGIIYITSANMLSFEDSGILLAVGSSAFVVGILLLLGGRRILLWVKAGYNDNSKISN